MVGPNKSRIKPDKLPPNRAGDPLAPNKRNRPAPSRRVGKKALADNESAFNCYFRMGAARTLEGLVAELAGTPHELSLDDLTYMSRTYKWDARLKVWDDAYEEERKTKAIEMRGIDMDLALEIQMGQLRSFKESSEWWAQKAQENGEPPPTLIASQKDLNEAVKNLILLAGVNKDGTAKGSDDGGSGSRAKAEAEAAQGMLNMFAAMAGAFGLKVVPGVMGGPMVGGASLSQGQITQTTVVDIPSKRAEKKPVGEMSERDLLDALHDQAKKSGEV